MKTKTPKPLKLNLPIVAVNFIFKADRATLTLFGCQLATYLVCSAVASSPRSKCRFVIARQQLVTATGYCPRQINRAIQYLLDKGYILRLGVGDHPLYELGSPNIGGLKHSLAGDKVVTLRTVLMYNHMPYLQLPKDFFTQLPRMTSVELQATIVMLEKTAYSRSLRIKAAEWAKQANIANTRDLCAVIGNMNWCAEIEQIGRTVYIERIDADRREERADRAMLKAIADNHALDPPRPYSRVVLAEWLTALGLQTSPGNGEDDLEMFCPECNNVKRPTLSINLDKGDFGVFYCKACRFGKGKVVLHLLDKLNILRKTYMNKLREISERTQALNSSATSQ